jgi:hypothetical protein
VSTGGDKEKPADDVDADLQITTSFVKVDTEGGKTTSQIEHLGERLLQEHSTNDEIDTIRKLLDVIKECVLVFGLAWNASVGNNWWFHFWGCGMGEWIGM